MSAIFYFPILKNGKSRLFLLRVSNSKVLNAERIREFHCEKGVCASFVNDVMLLRSGRQENLINHPGRNSKRLTPEVGTKTYPPPWVVTNNYFAYGSYRNLLSQ